MSALCEVTRCPKCSFPCPPLRRLFEDEPLEPGEPVNLVCPDCLTILHLDWGTGELAITDEMTLPPHDLIQLRLKQAMMLDRSTFGHNVIFD